MLAGVLSNLLLAWMYVTVRASQVVTGIIFNVLALGAANYLNRTLMGDAAGPEGVPFLPRLDLPVLSDLPFVGPVLFSQPAMLYFTLAAVVAADRLLFRTHLGLDLRAVGENPRAAATAGIHVRRLRYLATLVSGASAAAAGAYFVVCEIGLFRDGMVAGRGFIALAIVILGRWNPYRAALAAFAFGAADALPLSLQMLDIGVPAQALLALPYVMTILVMSGLFGRARQPLALMTAYADD
jgi:simple sugar transport system permease protein